MITAPVQIRKLGGVARFWFLRTTSPVLETVSFSTFEVARQEKLEYWHSRYQDLWGAVECVPHRNGAFDGKVESTPVGDLRFNHISIIGHDLVRTPENVSRNHGREFALLALPRTRRMDVVGSGGDLSVAPGKLYLLDNSGPYRVKTNGRYDTTNIMIPLREVTARIPNFGSDYNRSVSEPGQRGGLLYDTFMSLFRELGHMRADDMQFMRRHLLDLLYFVAADPERASRSEESSVVWAHRKRVLAYMRQNFEREDLDAAAIADAVRVSVSYLHRLFRSSGMSVREHLQEMRLDHANQMLTSGRHAGRSITEVAFACGFRSSQEFSRSFRQRFACSPSEARRLFSEMH